MATNGSGAVKRLATRADGLRAEMEKSSTRESELTERLEEAKQALASGTGTAAAAARAARALENARSESAHLREALTAVESELAKEEQRAYEEAQAAERDRQEKAAEPRRREADRLLDEAVQSMTVAVERLRERAAVVEEVASEMPLARPIDRVLLDNLVARVRPTLDGDYSVEPVRHWLRRYLAGPDGYGWVGTPPLPDRHQKNLGLVDR